MTSLFKVTLTCNLMEIHSSSPPNVCVFRCVLGQIHTSELILTFPIASYFIYVPECGHVLSARCLLVHAWLAALVFVGSTVQLQNSIALGNHLAHIFLSRVATSHCNNF